MKNRLSRTSAARYNRGMSKADKPDGRGLTRREWMIVLILGISAVLFRVAVSIFPERPATDRGDRLPPAE
jgi:hypothetical protein